jgi:hypothetical protein
MYEPRVAIGTYFALSNEQRGGAAPLIHFLPSGASAARTEGVSNAEVWNEAHDEKVAPPGRCRKLLTRVPRSDYIIASRNQKGGEHWMKACIDMGRSELFQSEQEETAKMPRGTHERIVIATIFLAVLVVFTSRSAKALDVGDKAPDFLAFSTVGESVRLADYQGKKNVLLFFFWRAFGGV